MTSQQSGSVFPSQPRPPGDKSLLWSQRLSRHTCRHNLIINGLSWSENALATACLTSSDYQPVCQASELWKPLMDEIWTSIFLSRRLLNKSLFKVHYHVCRHAPRSQRRREHEDVFWQVLGLMGVSSCWAREAWRQRGRRADCLMISFIANQ